MKSRVIVVLIAGIFLFSNIWGQEYSASMDLGFKGVGLSLSKSFSEQINARVGFSYFTLEVEGGDPATDDYVYTANPKLTTLNVLADYFPFENWFRVTGGVVFNLNVIDTKLTPTQTYTIGGDSYTPEEMGDLNANITFPPVAPYLGIGFGNAVSREPGFSYTLDFGTFYQGAAKVDLTAEGLLSPSASSDQEQTLENNLSSFKWYPVVTFSVNYTF